MLKLYTNNTEITVISDRSNKKIVISEDFNGTIILSTEDALDMIQALSEAVKEQILVSPAKN